ncbi:uricase-2 [Macadamia integrifolia]|uniref:uricase-2 n=1 Tax=Macadamia integrifolia TaxID=60698 RepID=UPI001C533AFD|nr:uricase-2 [Macadamia integrifolia]XP_042476844.1 uricase-2 [Macadamia integrifolia]XP_042476845.1 uricase-2 [Macadamia integrifolia]XP_042476846.1 uricase-2 [Macadamia integrifolia]
MAIVVDGLNFEQQHGKSRVRVARVWRNLDGRDLIVEWNVNTSLFSNCLPSYVQGDNSDLVTTDTVKNTVYAKAKECAEVISVENFAIALGKHFTSYYPKVTGAVITIVEKPWERVHVDGQPHEHGFQLGSEKHTTEVTVKKSGAVVVTSGIEGWSVLKTTKSGFEGYIKDKYTALPETKERILATEVSALWRYKFESLSSIPLKPLYFTEGYLGVKKVLERNFFGPPKGGVYSPSVQGTLYDMARAVIDRFPDISSIHLQMPNIHFLPVNLPNKITPSIVKFDDDVYTPTDEPHGTIQASLSRILSRM